MKTKICSIFGLAAFVIAPLFAGAAIADLEAIKPDGFARGVVLTVAGYDANRTTLTDFPVLVRISESNETNTAGISGFDYDDMMFPSNGDDLCFVADDGTPLAFDIDTWNPAGTSLVWVKLPSMQNGTEFAMFYRSSKSGKSVCNDNPFSDYVGVWHLGEAGDAVQDILDAGPNNLAAKSSDKSLAKSDGPIGGARQITTERAKADKAIKVTGTAEALAALNTLGTDFSVSFWARPIGSLNNTSADAIGFDGLIGRKSAKTTAAWAIQLTDNVKRVRIWTSQTVDTNFGITGEIFQFAKNVWGKIDVVYTYATSDNQPRITAYWNGANVYGPVAPWKGAVQAQGSLTLAIGGYVGSDERSFLGDMDEVRVSTMIPSADWIKADYDTANSATFLSAGTVAEFVELPKPVAAFSLLDSGAAFAQFGGSISSLGGTATSADVYYKIWPVSGTEPAEWTLLAPGLEAGDSFEGIVTNLTPQIAYTNLLKVVNDLETPYDSDIATLPFTTSGAGEAGTGGSAKRVGDDIVHTFTVDPVEGDTWEFIPPSYATTVEALVVAGGGPGGYFGGAGGGAGGLIYNTEFLVTGGATYTVKVGSGGKATSAVTAWGTNGGGSSIASNDVILVSTTGGGAGGNGNLDGQTATRSGVSGGSGGGSTDSNSPYEGGSGMTGQGNAGGTGLTASDKNRLVGAGGGGAGGVGGSVSGGNTVSGGSGGDGRELRISGVAAYYAAGGGGGGRDNKDDKGSIGGPGAGGNGIGGNGGMFTVADAGTEWATGGKDGTGSGGGGGSTIEGAYGGGDGGNGVVIIRYPIQGNGTTMPNPAIALTSATYDAEHSEVSFTYRVAWAGYGYQLADVSIAWGYSPSALSTTNTVATDKIGSGSGTVTLPNVSKTVYLRAVATNKGGYADDSVETAVFTLFNPDAPVGSISLSSAAVTNATFAVEVTDFGTDAIGASVTVEVCASEDFTGTILSFPAAEALSETGTVSVVATGLSRNSSYYARAIVTNNRNVELTTDAIEFSTLAPGAPVGTATAGNTGFTTLSARARVTNFGLNASAATVRLEASTAADFATLAATSAETAASLNANVALTASGLDPDTYYYWRVRIRNDWDVDTYVSLPFTSTHAVPFAAAGPLWTSSGDTIAIKLAVSAVYDGVECSAVLTYGDTEVGTQAFTAAGDVTWSGLTAKADGTVATIVVTAIVDGTDYVRTFSAPVMPDANATAVTDVSTYCSAANALWMRPGDVAMLPDLYGNASYEVLNERFATLDRNVLTAQEPGIVGVRYVDATYVTNIMGVVILPDAIGDGSVYVFDETKHGWNDSAYSWSNPNCWRKVVNGAPAASNDSFPQYADDIAILPFHSHNYSFIRHLDDITIGGLYAGMIRPDVSFDCVLERYKDVTTKTVTFQRTDGQPVRIQVCPNGENNFYSRIRLGGWPINVVWASDAVIDGASSETDASRCRGFFDVNDTTPFSTNTLQGVTLTIQGLPGYWINKTECTVKFCGIWNGTGEIVKKGMGGITFPNDIGGFSGTFREASAPNLGGIGAPAAGFLARGAGASNVIAHVYGCIAPNATYRTPNINGAGHGFYGTGGQSVDPTPSQAPGKGLHMHGGTYCANAIPNTAWGVGVRDDKVVDVLSVGAGFNFIQMRTEDNSKGNPINAFTAKTLAQTGKGTLGIYDPSHNSAPASATTNSLFYVLDRMGAETDATGDPLTAVDYPIVPWIVAPNDSNWSQLYFASFDADGRLVRPGADANTQITQATSTNANARIWSRNLDYDSSVTNITIQSLYISNGSNNRWLGADRTLRITSGGLILHGQSAIGLPGRADNGRLVLGDATHPAYVYSRNNTTDTNNIWSAVSAPGGFVLAYTGNLALGGDQTGIAGEIVVNGGTLALGDAEHGITLANGLPIRVCAGAKLILPSRDAVEKNPLKIDGSGGAFGKVELSVDQACASLAVRDVFESDEWTTLPEGTYGSSESAAEFVRDDLFVGPGVLRVGAAPTPNDIMFLIY